MPNVEVIRLSRTSANQPGVITFSNFLGANNADLTHQVCVVPTGGFRISAVRLNSADNIAAHATNYYDLNVMAGATVIATRNHKTGEGGAITGGTPVSLTVTYAEADQVAGTALTFKFAKNGTAPDLSAVKFALTIEYLPL